MLAHTRSVHVAFALKLYIGICATAVEHDVRRTIEGALCALRWGRNHVLLRERESRKEHC